MTAHNEDPQKDHPACSIAYTAGPPISAPTTRGSPTPSPIPFKLEQRLAGFAGSIAQKGESVSVIFRELLAPSDPLLISRLENFHTSLFSKIPNFPDLSRVGQLAITIDANLEGKAYIDNFSIVARARVNRSIEKGEQIFTNDILDIESVNFGIEIPDNAAIVVVQSMLWKRSLFFDFGPILNDIGPRDYPINRALAQQYLLLLGLPAPQPIIASGQTRIDAMTKAVAELERLLGQKRGVESEYQRLLQQNPWMLGASYSALHRHTKMDDENIPDYTALRAYDQCHDIVELKQPFLSLFRQDGNFTAAFNDAWNQAERYLDFCTDQRAYLFDRKQLRFENPRCVLAMGYNLSPTERRKIRSKEAINRLITVLTYDDLLEQARHILSLVGTAGDVIFTDNGD